MFERLSAKEVNWERYPADTGGKFDIYARINQDQNDHLAEGQCKYTKSLSHQKLSNLVQEMMELCHPHKFGCVFHKVPAGKGGSSPLLVTLHVSDFRLLFDAWVSVKHGEYRHVQN